MPETDAENDVKDRRFTLVNTPEERALIVELAQRLSRSQSDAVRYVILRAVNELRAAELAAKTISVEEFLQRR
jgi:hypothetical protein